MDLQQAYQRALAYLSRRDHSRYELTQKLRRAGCDDGIINKAIAQLVEDGYQDDLRFALGYCAYRARRGFGPLRIQQELQTKGVCNDITFEILTQPELDWAVLALKAWDKKFKGVVSTAAAARAKQWRFLLQRGFMPEHLAFLRP